MVVLNQRDGWCCNGCCYGPRALFLSDCQEDILLRGFISMTFSSHFEHTKTDASVKSWAPLPMWRLKHRENKCLAPREWRLAFKPSPHCTGRLSRGLILFQCQGECETYSSENSGAEPRCLSHLDYEDTKPPLPLLRLYWSGLDFITIFWINLQTFSPCFWLCLKMEIRAWLPISTNQPHRYWTWHGTVLIRVPLSLPDCQATLHNLE